VLDPTKLMGGTLPDLPLDARRASGKVAHPGFDPALLQAFKGGLVNLFDVALLFLEEPVPWRIVPRVY